MVADIVLLLFFITGIFIYFWISASYKFINSYRACEHCDNTEEMYLFKKLGVFEIYKCPVCGRTIFIINIFINSF